MKNTKTKKDKIVLVKQVQRTTAELYSWTYFSLYDGFLGDAYLSFYGTNASKLQNELSKFMNEKEVDDEKQFQINKQQKIEKLEEKLLITKKQWFSDPREEIKREIEDLRKTKYSGLDYLIRDMCFRKFLFSKDAVKIHTNESSTIYEIF